MTSNAINDAATNSAVNAPSTATGGANKKISQDYFDSIVAENLNDFGMEQQEAIDDAVSQLRSQGADLSTICKYSADEQMVVKGAVAALDKLLDERAAAAAVVTAIPNAIDSSSTATTDSSADVDAQIMRHLDELRAKFNKDLSFRCLASRIQPTASASAYAVFMKYFDRLMPPTAAANACAPAAERLIECFLATFAAYLHQQSDVLDAAGLRMLIRLTDSEPASADERGLSGYGAHPVVLRALLRCINAACQLSESNRQFFVENGLCENLMRLFVRHRSNDAVLCEACQLVRSLLLDDDVRVEFGHAHEHAKFIASKLNGLDVLLHIGLADETALSEETLGNIMLTLSRLAVRNEFCQEICDKGGLRFVIQCIDEKHLTNMALLRSALSLLKSICNNDQVKHEATKSNAVELLRNVLHKYVANSQICELGCAALSTLLLRNVEACEQLYALHAHPVLVQLLSMHTTKPKLIKNCCLALRNSVSRNKSLGEKLRELGIERTLRVIMNQNDPQCFEEAKAVLRDLDCQIELKELWTGSGKDLQHD